MVGKRRPFNMEEEFKIWLLATKGQKPAYVLLKDVCAHYNVSEKEGMIETLRLGFIMDVDGDAFHMPQQKCFRLKKKLVKTNEEWLAAIIFILFQYSRRKNHYMLITNDVEQILKLSHTVLNRSYEKQTVSAAYTSTRVRSLLSIYKKKGLFRHSPSNHTWSLNNTAYNQLLKTCDIGGYITYEMALNFVRHKL